MWMIVSVSYRYTTGSDFKYIDAFLMLFRCCLINIQYHNYYTYIKRFHLLLFLCICKWILYLTLNLILWLLKPKSKDVYLSVNWFITVIEKIATRKFITSIYLATSFCDQGFLWNEHYVDTFSGRWYLFVPMLRSGWKKINRTLLPYTVREARVVLAPWFAPGLYTVGCLKKQR